ncbi:MAG: sigma-70 family RNA polymerase sigma factor [Planctomycetes bacterium]|nr:sigma-70 family RNA polymerase sigma factor [Planctomycetota bacterium]
MNRSPPPDVALPGLTSMPEDDRELMVEAAAGSRESFSALVTRWESRLLSFFFRQCGDRGLAEDCAQEVFVRLYKSRDRYQPEASFATFIFTIARHYWIDVARARRVRPDQRGRGEDADQGEDRLERVVDRDVAPPMSAMLADDVVNLRGALARLPENLRDAVQLGVIEALPYAEVSVLLGIPIGTVKSRVHAAVQALRKLLLPGGTA